ncbi:AAA family ATPase [Magnetospirillum sp. XM-1]|uniref:AAA family ATPase n=1 Tax=Magnetospirillum sp. XM-1 TaxID=1663591 RepID=UPI0012E352C3|nr:AAA family ATPase [Magnetospirillum sp. XM-1]
MQLIKKIEISYLRSLHKAVIDSPGDLNLLFGRNDSGKSNVLRGLSLFFNGVTEPGRDLDFALDFSDIRRKEVKAVKGKQFISVRVDFNVPSNYRRSLGDTVSLKR